MTDYFDPANWDGIAVKNGYVLVIDSYSKGTIGGDFIKTSYDTKIVKKIDKLKSLRDCPNASKGEKDNAQNMIDKLAQKVELKDLIKSDLPPVSYQATPKGASWHIERGGNIVAKGKGVFIFSTLEHELNRDKSEYFYLDSLETNKNLGIDIERYYSIDDWDKFVEYRKNQRLKNEKLLDKYFSIIEKWNNISSIKIGDGEEDLQKVIVEDKITYYTFEDVDYKTDYMRIGDRWRVTGFSGNTIFKITDNNHVRQLTKTWLEDNKRGFLKIEPRKNTKNKYLSINQTRIDKGVIQYVKPVKNELVTKVEKWVKPKKENYSDKWADLFFKTISNSSNIKDFKHTKTGEILKVFTLEDQLSKEDFKEFNKWLKDNENGYYSRYAKGFILTKEPFKEVA
jgi:hypothetical protein